MFWINVSCCFKGRKKSSTMETVDKAIRSKNEISTGKIKSGHTQRIEKSIKHTNTHTHIWGENPSFRIGIHIIIYIYMYIFQQSNKHLYTHNTLCTVFFVWPTFVGPKDKPYKITFNLFVHIVFQCICEKSNGKFSGYHFNWTYICSISMLFGCYCWKLHINNQIIRSLCARYDI